MSKLHALLRNVKLAVLIKGSTIVFEDVFCDVRVEKFTPLDPK